jgi:hypothetical protein
VEFEMNEPLVLRLQLLDSEQTAEFDDEFGEDEELLKSEAPSLLLP